MAEDESWKPRSWSEPVAGCIWLGRMIDKGRRHLASIESGADLLGDYQFGDHNPTDAIMLLFLRLRGDDVLAILRETPDDDGAAGAAILALARRDDRAVRAWNAGFSLLYRPVLIGLDADEGRVPPTPLNRLFKTVIDVAVYPVAAAWYRWRTGARRTG